MRRKWTDLWWALFLLAGLALVGRLASWGGPGGKGTTDPTPSSGSVAAFEVTVGHVKPGMTRAEVEKLCGPYLRVWVHGSTETAEYTSDRLTIRVHYDQQRVVEVEGPHFEREGTIDGVAAQGRPSQSTIESAAAGRVEYTVWRPLGLSVFCQHGTCTYRLRPPPR